MRPTQTAADMLGPTVDVDADGTVTVTPPLATVLPFRRRTPAQHDARAEAARNQLIAWLDEVEVDDAEVADIVWAPPLRAVR